MHGFAKIQCSPKTDVNNKIQIVSGFLKKNILKVHITLYCLAYLFVKAK